MRFIPLSCSGQHDQLSPKMLRKAFAGSAVQARRMLCANETLILSAQHTVTDLLTVLSMLELEDSYRTCKRHSTLWFTVLKPGREEVKDHADHLEKHVSDRFERLHKSQAVWCEWSSSHVCIHSAHIIASQFAAYIAHREVDLVDWISLPKMFVQMFHGRTMTKLWEKYINIIYQ